MSAQPFRILRERRTRAGVALEEVESPLMRGCTLSLWAVDAETAIANAKQIGVTGKLVAIASAS